MFLSFCNLFCHGDAFEVSSSLDLSPSLRRCSLPSSTACVRSSSSKGLNANPWRWHGPGLASIWCSRRLRRSCATRRSERLVGRRQARPARPRRALRSTESIVSEAVAACLFPLPPSDRTRSFTWSDRGPSPLQTEVSPLLESRGSKAQGRIRIT